MKSNKKRILFVLAILTMALVLSFVFVACDKTEPDKTGTDIVSEYKVTIHPNNGQSDIVWDITKEIPTITKDGFHIAGYFLDAQLTISTTLESLKATGLTKNVDVYVKWAEDVCEHVEVIDNAVAPTCTEKGLTEGKHCSKCNEILKAQTEIPALGHDLEHHAGQSATCTEKGWEEYVTCKRDGCTYTTYEEIPALGHDYKDGVCTRCGDDCTSKGLVYSLDSNKNSYTVTGIGDCTDKYIVIPSEYNSKPVKSIGSWAFEGCSGLTSITIPSSVTSIGNYAFSGCTGLTSITVSENNSAYSSVDGILYNKNKTKIIHVPEAIKVATIPDSVTSIGSSTFSGCSSLESITIPFVGAKAGVTSSDTYQYPFGYIFGTLSYTGGVATEQDYYGNSTSSTTSTTYYIPSSLKSVTVTGGNILYGAFSGCKGLTSITIPNSVTSIGSSAFSRCTGLTSITIPNRVTSIGRYAFYYCSGLTSVTIPDRVTSIGDGAFSSCDKLQDIYITDIAAWCNISGLDNLMEYGVSDKNLYINNELVTSITIPNSVTRIGSSAFRNCTGLTSVTIPNSVTSIGYQTFYGCTGLTSIIVDAGNTKYHSAGNCLIETETKTLILGCNTSVIPTDGSVTSIGSYAFAGCTGLTSVTIPDSVTSIGGVAFSGCKGLTSITIPNSVTSIGSSAFSRCTGLTRITFNGTIEEWNAISKERDWKEYVPATEVVCTDGTISI